MNNTNDSINTIWEDQQSTTPTKNEVKPRNDGNQNITSNIRSGLTEKDLRDYTRVSGIYIILNKINNKYYVGSGEDLSMSKNGRWHEHTYLLKNNKHFNRHLQFAWNKYGESAFEFHVVELVKPIKELLSNAEQRYLDWGFAHSDLFYNISKDTSAPMRDRTHTKETRKTISDGQMGNKNHFFNRHHTIETINQIRNTKLNNNAKGERSYHYNSSIYTFYNKFTKEEFIGTPCELYTKYNLSQSKVVLICQGKRSHHKGWTINEQEKTNSNTIKRTYNFYNTITKEYFTCNILMEFIRKYSLVRTQIYKLINKKIDSYYGWVLVNS